MNLIPTLVLDSDADNKVYIKSSDMNIASVRTNISLQLLDPASWQSYILTAHK